MSPCQTAAVIPAYNVVQTLPHVVSAVRSCAPNLTIIVVNDGSSDATGEVARQLGVAYVEHPRNRGKGAALQRGFSEALRRNLAYILTLDADTQHSPNYIGAMMSKMKREKLDLVIGSRMSDLAAMPTHRVISNKITSGLISLRVGERVVDSQSGFRLFRSEVVRKLAFSCQRFDFESEFLLKAILAGNKIGFVDIEAIYPETQASYVKAVDILRFIRLYMRSWGWKRNARHQQRNRQQ